MGSGARRQKGWFLKTVLTSLGFTAIFLLWLIQPGIEPEQRAFYHWSGNPNGLFLAIGVDMLGAWLLLTLLLLVARNPGKVRVAIWSSLLLLTPWFIYQNYRVLLFYEIHNRRYSPPLFFVALIAAVLLTAYWRPAFSRSFEKVVASATTILIFAGIFGVFLLSKLAWYGWQGHLISERTAFHDHQTVVSNQPHHVIWIVFDELSQQQTYDHRFPDLQLPAFDALAQQATVFTQATPPDIYTQIVIPGLMAGKPFDQIRTSSTGQLFTHDLRVDKWQAFDQLDTVFHDAHNAGYTTAVAGWYNPYCRILPQVLDQCMWSFRDHKTNGMIGSESIAYNSLSALHFFACMALTVIPDRIHRTPLHCRAFFFDTEPLPISHARDYQDLNAASQELLGHRSSDFTFLHLPIPHPGGIYDRSTGRITTSPSSTYIDNLALTDKCFADLRAILEKTGQWNSSTVVVMGDHSWRTTQLWMPSNLWSPEEQKASLGGKYDPRPVFIVKLPGQATGSRIDTPFHTVDTRKLLDAVMANQITTPAELSTWAQTAH
jgi:hypothetical protein